MNILFLKNIILKFQQNSAKLLTLAIGLLGDLSAQTNIDQPNEDKINEFGGKLQFSAQFFDAYLNYS